MENFENKKSEVLNEILESARSLNNNGFKNSIDHLNKSKRLLDNLINELKQDGMFIP